MKSARESYWFDASALTRAEGRSVAARLSSLRPLGRFSDKEHDALASFADANGLRYDSSIGRRERELPSRVLTSTRESVVSYPSVPQVEFGNYGWRYLPSDLNEHPNRRGYVAVQHGMDLPEVFTQDTSLRDRPSLLGMASKVIEIVDFFDPDSPVDSRDEGGAGPPYPYQRLDLPPGHEFVAWAEKKRYDEASGLVTGYAFRLLAEIATSFDIEMQGGWLFVYSHHGELSTLDPDTWAWAFSVASRMLDIVDLWGADFGGDRSDVPFYTTHRIERPARASLLGRRK